MLVGYARVSTVEQETDLQLRALRSAGAVEIYQEKASAVSRRPQLEACLSSLTRGDVLLVWKLDRLARSLRDLMTILERLHAVGSGIRSVTEPIDTSTPIGTLLIHVLGAVAQFERSLIRERAIAGQVEYVKRGGVMGRPKKVTVEQESEILYRICMGESWTQVAKDYGVSRMVVRRVWREAHGRVETGTLPLLRQYIG